LSDGQTLSERKPKSNMKTRKMQKNTVSELWRSWYSNDDGKFYIWKYNNRIFAVFYV